MTIVTTMCKLLFAMLIGFYLFKKDILTKEVNAKLSSLIVQITCPCIQFPLVTVFCGGAI